MDAFSCLLPDPAHCLLLPPVTALVCAVVADAKKEWANGARKLLESDDVRRQTRKGGSG